MSTVTLARRSGAFRFGSLILGAFRMHDTWRQRRALRELPDAILHDIGLSRSEVEAEARRPIWDVPARLG